MICPHSSHGTPDRCSQCRGAPVQHVAIVGNEAQIDGVTARPVEPVRTPFGRNHKRPKRWR